MTPDDWVVRPERFVRYLRDQAGLTAAEVRLPPRGIMVFARDDFRLLTRALHARILKWNDGFGFGRVGATNVVVVRTTIGAPAAAINLEEAIALGLRRVITFGACGSLRDDLPIGSVVLPTRAYSEEGTSRHYGGKVWCRPDPGLTNALREECRRRAIPVREGGTWTTDAPYRESRQKARSLARRGIVSVEMEAAALFQVARVRGVKIASLFVVSDELEGPEWNAGFGNPRYVAAMHDARGAVLEAVRRPAR